MKQLGIPEYYAEQFKGFTGQKPVYFGRKIGWRMCNFQFIYQRGRFSLTP
jgi:hypothetical protein